MKPFHLILFIFLFLFYFGYGQTKPRIIIDIPSQQKPWNNLEWNDSPEQFQFAIVTDRTGGHRPGVFMDGIRKLNLLQPEFVMSVGDFIEGYTEDEARLDAEWTEFNGFIDKLTMPFFYVPGNHDITNKVMETKWKELFGSTYYHFVYKDVLFLCLNSEDNYRGAGKGTIDDAQFEYIKKTLAENQDVKWTLVFLHQPMWIQEDTKRWKEVEDLLKNRRHNVFAGHYHRYWKSVRNNGKYIALATTGGGSQLRGTAYGEFDHVVWVTMTSNGPLLTNLLLQGIWDENIVTDDIVDLVRNRPFPVRIDPVYMPDVKQENLHVPVKITNDSDYRMAVKLDGLINPSVYYQLEKKEVVVEPNDVVLFDLELRNTSITDLTTIEPLKLNVEVTYEYEGRTDLVLTNQLNFIPMPRPIISKTKHKIKLDGNLKEWTTEWTTLRADNYEGSPFDFTGPEDFSLKFSTTYDDQNVYVAFEIKDDEFYADEKAAMWNQDVLIVGLDARPEHLSSFNTGQGRNGEWMMYLMNFGENFKSNTGDLPVQVQSAVQKTATGRTVELAIPITYLDKMHMKTWSDFRLDIMYYDYDAMGEKRTEHFWYPSWSNKENIPGSGMLFKNKN